MRAFWQIYSLIIVALLGHLHWISAHNTAAVNPPEASLYNGTLYAACKIRPNEPNSTGPKIYGMALFKQDSPQDRLAVFLQLRGFDSGTAEPKAVHIHQFGDLRSSCASTGGHYNPHHVNHPHHPGDFGNFMTENGRIKAMVESEATLFGGDSVLGRAVVVHQHQDDMGQGGDASSLLNGNAGPRVGCCVIGISSPDLWAMYADKLNP
ncbi:LOW QUALITY PROTEIN: extracellular superoxide dismutase [Cu-Zn] [Boleophthalmus pectinirostris]|uniref:LOW QUALITY PROTEIN: extracellular superoxide dismutase [Cu-Zn] n=1 Tax=Boleophthalmus pectinirostris TaxID=150288 RepID=UPI000A1C2B0E|nr:LOW QUALITY PROTEIN: extracellular superoxide dismutase [Cu-Zn] [Boleophthalmus pectinirostris]